MTIIAIILNFFLFFSSNFFFLFFLIFFFHRQLSQFSISPPQYPISVSVSPDRQTVTVGSALVATSVHTDLGLDGLNQQQCNNVNNSHYRPINDKETVVNSR